MASAEDEFYDDIDIEDETGMTSGFRVIMPYGLAKAKDQRMYTDVQFFKRLCRKHSAENQFVDDLFPPNDESLGELNLKWAGGEKMEVQWFRPAKIAKDLLGQDKPIFSPGKFDQFGVSQGMIADCWFLAVLADVARIPVCMARLVPADNLERGGFEKGIFHFRFWCRGEWTDVVIDDLLPCVVFEGKIEKTCFSKPSVTGGFWAPLLEKAYAKLYGNYGLIKGGFAVDAMKDFTGGLIETLDSAAVPDWNAKLEDCIKQKAIMAIGTIQPCPVQLRAPHDPNSPGNEHVSVHGIVCGHAYSLLDKQVVADKEDLNSKLALVKLRNPWGNKTEWSGPFSDKDVESWDKVTPNLRQNPEDRKDDGEFWMPLEYFVMYMDSFWACYWTGSYSLGQNDIKQNGPELYWQMHNHFAARNSGQPPTDPIEFKGKQGYLVHLKPADPTKELGEDGKPYKCTLDVNLLYCDYIKSGFNKHIPPMGFMLLWAPGYIKTQEFFEKAEGTRIPYLVGEGGARDMNVSEGIPPGTVFIAPWIKECPNDHTGFVIRIRAEGEAKLGWEHFYQ